MHGLGETRSAGDVDVGVLGTDAGALTRIGAGVLLMIFAGLLLIVAGKASHAIGLVDGFWADDDLVLGGAGLSCAACGLARAGGVHEGALDVVRACEGVEDGGG